MRNFLIFTMLIIASNAIAQPIYFNNRYDFFNHNSDLSSSIALTDSGYLIACTVGNSILSHDNLGFLSLDKYGNILWTKTYGQSGYYYYSGYNSMYKLPNGNYIDGGEIVDSTGNYSAFLTKLAPNGDTLWFKVYTETNYGNAAYQIRQTIDGGFILAGGTNFPDSSNYNILLLKTDSLGNLQWQNNYGISMLTDVGFSIDICTNGDYIIGGYHENSSSIHENYILRIDSLGVLKWDTIFGSHSIAIVSATPDNGFVAATDFVDSVVSSYSYNKLYILKFDSVGHTIWYRQYGEAGFILEPYTIIKTTDGGFAITGNTATGSYTANNVHINGFIARIDSIGNNLWYNSYDNAQYVLSQNYLTDIKQTPDGGFVACGYVFPQAPDTGTQDIWVLKVDSNGCEVPWCLGTGINELPVIKTEVKIFPNPANTVINISLPNYTPNETLLITNVLGEVIHQETLSGVDNSIDVSKWSAGVYFYQLLSDKETYRGKFIKQ